MDGEHGLPAVPLSSPRGGATGKALLEMATATQPRRFMHTTSSARSQWESWSAPMDLSQQPQTETDESLVRLEGSLVLGAKLVAVASDRLPESSAVSFQWCRKCAKIYFPIDLDLRQHAP